MRDTEKIYPVSVIFEDKKVFTGFSFCKDINIVSEFVFNTAMTGYQEVVTDPSYCRQTIIMTYPHIGNVGCNDADNESKTIFCDAILIHDLTRVPSNWRANEFFLNFLDSRNIPVLFGFQTRTMTRYLARHGTKFGLLISGTDVDALHQDLINSMKQMKNTDLVSHVSCKSAYTLPQVVTDIKKEKYLPRLKDFFHVVVIDYGVKHTIIRCLMDYNYKLTVVPCHTTCDEILKFKPDGIVLSNGPGNPQNIPYAVDVIRNIVLLQKNKQISSIPMLAICLGHQILSLALGGEVYKLPFGHHGSNHSVINFTTGRIEISAHNHNFSIHFSKELQSTQMQVIYENLLDNTLEGFKHAVLPIISVQYHPEASSGPHDSRYVFDDFFQMMRDIEK